MLAIVFIVGLIAGLRHKITSLEEWGTTGRSLNVLVNYFTAHATQLSALQYMGFVSFMLYVWLRSIPSTLHYVYAHYVCLLCTFLRKDMATWQKIRAHDSHRPFSLLLWAK